MKKLLLSHFRPQDGFSNGVVNYSKAATVASALDFELLQNVDGLDESGFQHHVYRHVTDRYTPDDVLIEAPESQASTLLLPRRYRVHIRMHCPFHLYKRIIRQPPDEARFSRELRAIYKAQAVSSPSHGMLELLSDDIDPSEVHVFKNPVPKPPAFEKETNRDIDVLFLLRFNRLKGVEFINPILRLLPSSYRVVLAGKKEERFSLDSRVRCRVEILDHVEGVDKWDLLRRAKTSISLSKFENCSMVILESLAAHTPVICWDVGGNAEIAPPSVLRAVAKEDVFGFAEAIMHWCTEQARPKSHDFGNAIDAINGDFESGSRHVEAVLRNETSEIYKGLDHRPLHRARTSVPYELRGASWSALEDPPLKCVLLARRINTAQNVSRAFLEAGRPLGLIVTPENIHNHDTSSALRQLDWSISENRQSLISLVKNADPDLVVIERYNGSSPFSPDDLTHDLKRPILHLEALDESRFLVDRDGAGPRSFFRSRSITGANLIDAPEWRHAKELCVLAASDPYGDTRAKAGIARDIVRLASQSAAETIRVVASPSVNAELAIMFRNCKRQFKFSDKPTKEALATHVILALSDMYIDRFLEMQNVIYSFHQSRFDNKFVLIPARTCDSLDGTEFRHCHSPENRIGVLSLLRAKTLCADLGPEHTEKVLDEAYAALNRLAFLR